MANSKKDREFRLHSEFKPAGSQPQAIDKLYNGLLENRRFQTLLGVTGSGKTFTMANIIEKYKKPALVVAHNKTLAAQLYNEFKEFFPENRVEYFVSFYDYYQPESYIPQKDQYIEKDSQINERLEQMRMAATASLVSRDDVIVVASVSCIYSAGNPSNYKGMGYEFKTGELMERRAIFSKLTEMQYERNDVELQPGRFRVRGETIDIIPAYMSNIVRLEMFGEEIERIVLLDKVTARPLDVVDYFHIYPARHFVAPEDSIKDAVITIKDELEERLPELDMIEAHRLKQRTLYDIDMLNETGFCKGIENYSRHFDKRKPGEKPFCLLDYFPEDFLMFIDESHQTLPQVRGMYRGDYARKKNLIEYGFRLPSAFDNRPLKFEEFENFMNRCSVICVSATPGDYETDRSSKVVEQIIRPTGLVDPVVEVRPVEGQIEDLRKEIDETVKKGNRVLITTLTKRFAEELTDYMGDKGYRTRYLHSEIDTIERTELIRSLRQGEYDILVGINLLREGLDIPEVGFIGVLDADKEGFLRDTRSLIQIIGRAARNLDARVVLYGDKITDSMKRALDETNRRRLLQQEFNLENGITPVQVVKAIPEKKIEMTDTKHIPKSDIPQVISNLEKEMNEAADRLDFEYAIQLRDKLNRLKSKS